LNRAYAKIMQADTELREMSTLTQRVEALEGKKAARFIDLDRTEGRYSMGAIGGGMLLMGGLGLIGWHRKKGPVNDRNRR
jgi:hypothetical protein